MALLGVLERAEDSQVADLVTRLPALLFEDAANQGSIEEKLHGSILSSILLGRHSAIYSRT
jgi:hypothetical protein